MGSEDIHVPVLQFATMANSQHVSLMLPDYLIDSWKPPKCDIWVNHNVYIPVTLHILYFFIIVFAIVPQILKNRTWYFNVSSSMNIWGCSINVSWTKEYFWWMNKQSWDFRVLVWAQTLPLAMWMFLRGSFPFSVPTCPSLLLDTKQCFPAHMCSGRSTNNEHCLYAKW